MFLSYRNQLVDLQDKSTDRFPYDGNIAVANGLILTKSSTKK